MLAELPPIEQAAGELAFTDSGFALQGVRGRLLGGALTAAGGTQPRGAASRSWRAATPRWSRRAPSAARPSARASTLSGGFAYAVNVQAKDGLAAREPRIAAARRDSALPVPLAKSAVETLPLRVDIIPAAGGERDRIAIALGSACARRASPPQAATTRWRCNAPRSGFRPSATSRSACPSARGRWCTARCRRSTSSAGCRCWPAARTRRRRRGGAARRSRWK